MWAEAPLKSSGAFSLLSLGGMLPELGPDQAVICISSPLFSPGLLRERVHPGLETHGENVTVESGNCLDSCQQARAMVDQGPTPWHCSPMFPEDLRSIKTLLTTENIKPAALFSAVLHRLQSSLFGGTCTAWPYGGLQYPSP